MGGAPTIEWIRDGVGFTPEAAAAFRRAEAQVRAEFGRDIDVNSTYRDWDTQLRMYNAWQAWITGRGPYPGHSKALHPSDPLAFHTKGLALDSDDWRNARIVQILAEHGFIRNRLYVKNENHHFEYLRDHDKHINGPDPREGFLMALTDQQQQQIYDNIVGKKQLDFAAVLADALLTRQVPKEGRHNGKKTTLRAVLGWSDEHIDQNRDQVNAIYDNVVGKNQLAFAAVMADVLLGRPVPRQGRKEGETTTLRAVLGWSDENIEQTREVVRALTGEQIADIDVTKLADALTKSLGPAVAAELAKRLAQ